MISTKMIDPMYLRQMIARVQGLGCRVRVPERRLCRMSFQTWFGVLIQYSWVQGSSFKDQGSGFRVQDSGFGIQGSGFRVQDSGFRIQGSGFRGDLFVEGSTVSDAHPPRTPLGPT